MVLDIIILSAAGLSAVLCGLEQGGWRWGEAILCFFSMAAPMVFPDYISAKTGAVTMLFIALRPVFFARCDGLMIWCRMLTGLIMAGLMWHEMQMPMTYDPAFPANGVIILVLALTLSAYVISILYAAFRLLRLNRSRHGLVLSELIASLAALIGMAHMSCCAM